MNAVGLQLVGSESAADRLIVGESAAIRQVRQLVKRMAQSNASVMLNGPSGAGKEVVARAIHEQSDRSDKPFVAINCGAIPPELIESELFGHERGSFTGAHARRIGRFEEANGGTLFLDEIGDMRFDMQVKLLRVLEERLITRVGGSGPIEVDVRIISATHQNLDEAIARGRFRQDLFFRLGVLPIHVPSLADRTEDVPLLIEHFQRNLNADARAMLSRDALSRLEEHDWPGNVRELRNFVERANVLFGGTAVGRNEVDELLGGFVRRNFEIADETVVAFPATDEARARVSDEGSPINLKELLETMELERIQLALDKADGVVSEAARLLTLKRTTLIEKMRKYSLVA
ncbi:MAG TPA: sigma-54 dependent transcriptional regulator [Sphingomicrobium sp.]|nr:sigma-54 dependent transcriptional regulator [Sphingomicrobium sp.]